MTDIPHGSYGTARTETIARVLDRLAGWLRGGLRAPERPTPPLTARARTATRDQDEPFSPLEEFH